MSTNKLYPRVVGPIVERILRTGPLEADVLLPLAASRSDQRGSVVRHWVKTGWLVKLPDGRYDAGPKAAVLPTLSPPNGLRHADQTAVEGSNQWLILAQLAHEPLREGDLAELLDVPVWKAQEELRGLAKLGYVRKVLRGPWELVKRMESAG